MTHLLDTDICSAHPAGLAHRFFQYGGGIAIPTIVLAELHAGANMHPNPARLLALIADLLTEVSVLDFDTLCAEEFRRIRGDLHKQNRAAPIADLMIASVAMVHNLTLVTHNTADYQGITGLRLDDWLIP